LATVVHDTYLFLHWNTDFCCVCEYPQSNKPDTSWCNVWSACTWILCAREYQNRRQSRLDELKIVENGGVGVSLGGLGCLWRKLDEGFSENRRQDELKMSQVSVKLDQERPKLGHFGAKMVTWCSTWSFLDRFWKHSWSILNP